MATAEFPRAWRRRWSVWVGAMPTIGCGYRRLTISHNRSGLMMRRDDMSRGASLTVISPALTSPSRDSLLSTPLRPFDRCRDQARDGEGAEPDGRLTTSQVDFMPAAAVCRGNPPWLPWDGQAPLDRLGDRRGLPLTQFISWPDLHAQGRSLIKNLGCKRRFHLFPELNRSPSTLGRHLS